MRPTSARPTCAAGRATVRCGPMHAWSTRALTTPAARGRGLGRELLRRAIAEADARFPGQGLRISAQHRLERFYEQAGFVSVGSPYLEDDLPHIEMLRR
jgi:ElaA protein